jgi:ribosomal 30S subunit maturation factor RimM
MIIKNLLNQPQMIDGKSLAVDGELKVKSVTGEAQRLADKGFVAIVEEPKKTPASGQGADNTPKEANK